VKKTGKDSIFTTNGVKMNNKCFSTLVALLAIFTLFVSATGVTAQIPDDIPEPKLAPADLRAKPEFTYSADETKSVSLGEPGTVFRHEEIIGISGEPYPADSDHLNAPHGVFIDSNDNLLVAEMNGHRLLKYDSSGNEILTIGYAGQPWHHDVFLSSPRDAIVDGDGNTWVVITHALKQFDPDGNLIQIFPADDPWNIGQDNNHFDYPQGIAFDSAGLLYVADSANQRIQIFDISSGSPVYVETIGITGEARSDNDGFDWPHRVALDSLDRLYVADEANFRIQRCTRTTEWTCETFFGVTDEYGSDTEHLGYVYGVEIQNDDVFIADTTGRRVLKCDLNGDCNNFAGEPEVVGHDETHFAWPTDVAIDSTGKVYVSDEANHRVQIFDSNGNFVSTRGVTLTPYLTDNVRLNTPWGITIANDGGLLLTENSGLRVIKYSSELIQEWAHGKAGDWVGEDAYSSLTGNPAQDVTGRIYFPDTWNHQIGILNESGDYIGSLGEKWISGDDNSHFDCPQGVAISPVNQDIYVVDTCNQRIQVFDNERVYKATLGVTDVSGNDNIHFDNPSGIAIDTLGNIYVADTGNYRVQKCTLNNSIYNCTLFVGEPGIFDSAFNHLFPKAVTVDTKGNVYVTDEWNARVQVFDNNGNYLTTVGGSWGYSPNQFTNPLGVAVNAQGQIFITDTNNHRIQKYTPGYPDWSQININGFGDIQNQVITSLQTIDDVLYAGTYNPQTGGQIWTSTEEGVWSQLTGDGFGNPYNVGINHFFKFNDKVYVSTWANETEGGELWRINNPTEWTRVVENGFGDPTNGDIFHLSEFNDQLYATTYSYTDTHGAEMWRSPSGDRGTWSPVVSNGFNGDVNNVSIINTAEFDGYIYASTLNNVTGGEIWRSSTGSSGSWTQVDEDGLGEGVSNNKIVLTAFKGLLFAGTRNDSGAQIWQSSNGTEWTKVNDSGFGNSNNIAIDNLFVYNQRLIAVTINLEEGMEVWSSTDGLSWDLIADKGFGDNSNRRGYWNHSAAIFNNHIILGTNNSANAGEIWQYDGLDYKVYLPVLLRNYSTIVVPSWKIAASPVTSKLNDVFSLSSSDIWAVGNAGVILRRNLSNWSSVNSPIANNLNSIFMVSSTDGWAVGDGGVIIRWNGSHWSTVSSPTANNLNAISMNSSTDGWAVGDGGVIIRWNGSSWSSVASPTAYDLEGLAFITGTNGWAVGGIWSTTVGWYEDAKIKWDGSNWSLYTNFRILDILYDVDFTSSSYGWAVGGNNAKGIWNGTSWEPSYTNTSMVAHFSVDMLDNNDGWAVGTDNLKSNIRHWDGATWAEETSPVGGALRGVSMISNTDGWAVGDNGVILHYTAGTP
jgi:sugar lactone lactonase YvrE